MFPLGHIGITIFLANLLSLSVFYAGFGVLVPDIIDKSLLLIGIAPSGRFIAHTLLGVFISYFVVFLITRKRIAALSLIFGYLLHFVEDMPGFLPWFYPFVSYEFPVSMGVRYGWLWFTLDMIGLFLIFHVYSSNHRFKEGILSFFEKMKKRLH